VLDDKIAVSDDRDVTHIDDLQDHRRAPAGLEPEQRPGWQGPALAPSGSPVTQL